MTDWHELKPSCYGLLDVLQFSFLRVASGLPYCGWDLIPEYLSLAKRKKYTLARKIAWIMAAANTKE